MEIKCRHDIALKSTPRQQKPHIKVSTPRRSFQGNSTETRGLMGAKDVWEAREWSGVTSDNAAVLVTQHGQYANVVEVHIYSGCVS